MHYELAMISPVGTSRHGKWDELYNCKSSKYLVNIQAKQITISFWSERTCYISAYHKLGTN